MCKRADCLNPTKAQHLVHWSQVENNPLFNRETDMMPDGFHAKPIRLWASKPQKKRIEPSMSPNELIAKRDNLDAEYAALPDPKPDYMDWASYKTRHDQFWEAYKILRTSPYPTERVKALTFLAEFTKSKPKQEFEVATRDLKGLDNEKLLEEVLELNGLPRDLAKQLKQGGGQ